MKSKLIYITSAIIAAFILGACNFPSASTPTALNPDLVETIAIQTVQALSTDLASTRTPFPTIIPTLETSTAVPPESGISSTLFPTDTLSPSLTPPPIIAPSTTLTSVSCDKAEFVSETMPDDSVVTAGTEFTKTWTLKNVGSCGWTSDYAVVFASGEAMSAPAASPIATGSVVPPGSQVTISIKMVAPSRVGSFKGEWLLRNAKLGLFGTGDLGNKTFWVKINVPGTTYSFINNICQAKWKNATDTLTCPGSTGDTKGFVIRQDSPHLENGSTDDEPALWMSPQQVKDGIITGEYPAIMVVPGSHFKTVLGCKYEAKNCYLKFILAYKDSDGNITTINEWTKKNTGSLISVNIDLGTTVGGKTVSFILTVKAIGDYNQDDAFWLLPRIEPN
jgi:Ig-like domain from next to BRCA1 gene